MRLSIAAATLSALLGLGRAACASAGAQCGDMLSTLQISQEKHHQHREDHKHHNATESDEVHVVFTVGCSPYQQWQVELLFMSAQNVHQRGPITAIISGCSHEREWHIRARIAALGLPPQYQPHFVPELNDNRSHVINKPYGVHSWFRTAGPQRDVVAVIDPDFLFVKPLTAKIDGAPAVQGWGATPPTRVQKGVIVSQRWRLMGNNPRSEQLWYPDWDGSPNMTDAQLLTWVCSGSATGKSGCSGVTKREIAVSHATGVPYIAHKDDWDEWLVDAWRDIAERLHTVYSGYFVDMLAWVLAPLHHGYKEVVVNNLQFFHHSNYEPWYAVDELDVDPCNDPMDKVLASPHLAYFIHYCHHDDSWNKHWFETAEDGPNVFERCDATATDQRLSPFLTSIVNVTKSSAPKVNKRKTFALCVTRRMFAAALRRACANHPVAELFGGVAAGFKM
mmetsp:Transcript_72679/g.210396  ORF Transcript_72679/g.210396 Transcript_72679/m.210396 type:complete len:449 (-) Transcript_72679:56-1402(-)